MCPNSVQVSNYLISQRPTDCPANVLPPPQPNHILWLSPHQSNPSTCHCLETACLKHKEQAQLHAWCTPPQQPLWEEAFLSICCLLELPARRYKEAADEEIEDITMVKLQYNFQMISWSSLFAIYDCCKACWFVVLKLQWQTQLTIVSVKLYQNFNKTF